MGDPAKCAGRAEKRLCSAGDSGNRPEGRTGNDPAACFARGTQSISFPACTAAGGSHSAGDDGVPGFPVGDIVPKRQTSF